MRVTDAPAGAAFTWFRQAFRLFMRQPLPWMSIGAGWLLLNLAAMFSLFPVGVMLAVLLQPALTAGVVIAAREADEGRPVLLAHLFAGFRRNGPALLAVGLLTLLLYAGIALAIYPAMDLPAAAAGTMRTPEETREAWRAMSEAIKSQWLPMTIAVSAFLVVRAMLWFSVPLLALQPMPVGHALRWSFFAFAGNFLPVVLVTLLAQLILFVGAQPMLVGLLAAMPLFGIAHYCSYRQVFGGEGP